MGWWIFGSNSVESLVEDLRKALNNLITAISNSSAPEKTKKEIINKIKEENLEALRLYNDPAYRKNFLYMLYMLVEEADF